MPKTHRAVWLKTCCMDTAVYGWILAERNKNNSAKITLLMPNLPFKGLSERIWTA